MGRSTRVGVDQAGGRTLVAEELYGSFAEHAIVRYATPEGGSWGVARGGKIYPAETPLSFSASARPVCRLSDARLLAPCEPGTIVAAAGNEHGWYEGGDPPPLEPSFFVMPPGCVAGPGIEVAWPQWSGAVTPEAEVAVVIGRKARCVPIEQARAYILGVTGANDLTALDRLDDDLFLAKCFEASLPLGPAIAPLDEPHRFSCTVDGALLQSSATDRLVFGIDHLVAAASRVLTLFPGDVILCGGAPRVEAVSRPSTLVVEVEGAGKLVNRLV
jgi:2-keto-4-pentenoate hydratase/2-oxohepta-3-ene-1,7-dioic acid hydratase in catechol pathway